MTRTFCDQCGKEITAIEWTLEIEVKWGPQTGLTNDGQYQAFCSVDCVTKSAAKWFSHLPAKVAAYKEND